MGFQSGSYEVMQIRLPGVRHSFHAGILPVSNSDFPGAHSVILTREKRH